MNKKEIIGVIIKDHMTQSLRDYYLSSNESLKDVISSIEESDTEEIKGYIYRVELFI